MANIFAMIPTWDMFEYDDLAELEIKNDTPTPTANLSSEIQVKFTLPPRIKQFKDLNIQRYFREMELYFITHFRDPFPSSAAKLHFAMFEKEYGLKNLNSEKRKRRFNVFVNTYLKTV